MSSSDLSPKAMYECVYVMWYANWVPAIEPVLCDSFDVPSSQGDLNLHLHLLAVLGLQNAIANCLVDLSRGQRMVDEQG